LALGKKGEGAWMQFQIIKKQETFSTMDAARELVDQIQDHCLVVWAGRQVSGRGRHGRSWVSETGGLYCSLVFRPAFSMADMPKLPLLVAVAVGEVLQRWGVEEARLKWPNDVLVKGQKIAGILMESESRGGQCVSAVIGIGVNINNWVESLPSGAVRLADLTNRDCPVGEVLTQILEQFNYWYEQAVAQGFSAVLQQWKSLSETLGRRVSVKLDGRTVEGVAVDLAEDGCLLVKNDQGELVKVAGGLV